MQKFDRYTKCMLTLLVAGVWATLLHSIFQPTPAEARLSHKYGLYVQNYDASKFGVYPDASENVGATVFFRVSGDNVGKAMRHASANGWRIINVSVDNNGGFVIFVEK